MIQLPARQRRRRRAPAQYQGPRKAKPPFPINLIFNVKAFYLLFIIIMIASLGGVGLYGSGGGSTRTPPSADDTTKTEPTPGNVLSFPKGPVRTIDPSKPHVAIIKTKMGDIKIQLATDAPKAVNSFAFLAGQGFYDGTTFFYVDKELLAAAQAGDPTCRADGKSFCSGVGGPDYEVGLEPTQEGHVQWAVVAPSLGEGRQAVHGSQFRILYRDDHRLDGQETVFGRVIEGQKVLESLSDIAPCSIASAANCAHDLSSALVIDEIIVQPA